MLVKFLFFVFTCLLPLTTFAWPKNVELIFVSIDKKEAINKNIKALTQNSKKVALLCEKRGEYCFDPQVGLYKPDSEEEVAHEKISSQEDLPSIETAKSVDRNMIECDGSNRFDIFCGKAKKVESQKNVSLELWIDVSSSMKQVDNPDKSGQCFRESFARMIDQKCKTSISVFNETKKEFSTYRGLCGNVGLNRTMELVKSLEGVTTENVIIITDIFEATEQVINFIENLKGGKVRGVKTPVYARDLKEIASDIMKKSCSLK